MNIALIEITSTTIAVINNGTGRGLFGSLPNKTFPPAKYKAAR